MRLFTYSQVFLVFIMTSGAFAQSELNSESEVIQLLAKDGQRTWNLEVRRTIASGGDCEAVQTTTFHANGRFKRVDCSSGRQKITEGSWKVVRASSEDTRISIDDVEYNVFLLTTEETDFVLFETPFEKRMDAATEFELSSEK